MLSSIYPYLTTIALTSLVSAQYSSNYYGQETRGGYCFYPKGAPLSTRFPLADNFPYTKPGSPEDKDIAYRAYGIRPYGQLPTSLTLAAITSLQIIAYTALYEVAYYIEILLFIRDEKPGYSIENSSERAYIVQALTAFTAQEEQHVLYVNGILERFGIQPVLPCGYLLPAIAKDFNSAINAAGLTAELFLGALQSVIEIFGEEHDKELIQELVAISETVGEQAGWFRSLNAKIPSANPFITAVSRDYLFSPLNQHAVVPGSCPDGDTIALASFEALTLVQPPIPCNGVDQTLEFSVRASDSYPTEGLVLAYVNQQNMPVLVEIRNPRIEDGCVNFYADFPCRYTTFGNGLTLAVIVNRTRSFQNIEELTYYTIAGPTVIEYN